MKSAFKPEQPHRLKSMHSHLNNRKMGINKKKDDTITQVDYDTKQYTIWAIYKEVPLICEELIMDYNLI